MRTSTPTVRSGALALTGVVACLSHCGAESARMRMRTGLNDLSTPLRLAPTVDPKYLDAVPVQHENAIHMPLPWGGVHTPFRTQ
jgi:hypothetical protein